MGPRGAPRQHPDDLDPDAARKALVALFEAGEIPPRGHNGELRLDCRAWGDIVEICGRRYRVIVVRDGVTIAPA